MVSQRCPLSKHDPVASHADQKQCLTLTPYTETIQHDVLAHEVAD